MDWNQRITCEKALQHVYFIYLFRNTLMGSRNKLLLCKCKIIIDIFIFIYFIFSTLLSNIDYYDITYYYNYILIQNG